MKSSKRKNKMELLTYIYKSAIVLTIFWGSYYLFLRKETLHHWNRQFLLLGILFSMLLPLWEITQTVIVEIPSASPMSETTEVLSPSGPHEEANQGVMALSWETLVFYGYLMGVFFTLVLVGFQSWSLFRLISKNPRHTEKGIHYITTQAEIAPFSFLKYIVYNPNRHSTEELEMILAHETVHVRDYHSFDMILAQLITVFQWYNPMAWSYRKAISENLEFIADRKTLSKVSCKKSYQLALVRTSSVIVAPMLTNSFYQSFIKKRIVMLNKNQSNRFRALNALITVPFLALFLYGFNLKVETKYVEVPEVKESYNTLMEATPPTVLSLQNESSSSSLKENSTPKIQAIGKSASAVTPQIKTAAAVQDFERTINKNTTDGELEAIKKELKEKFNMDFNYSRQRNAAGEIVALSMNYSGNGKNGNYQVTDEEGIHEFTFYLTEEGKSGFYSEAYEEQRTERMARMEERRAAMEEEMAARREALEKRRMETEEEMEERRMERLDRMEERREEQRARIAEERERHAEVARVVRAERAPRGEVRIVDDRGNHVVYEVDDNHSVAVVQGTRNPGVMITKNTTDAELAEIKLDLAAQGIEFNYRNVKRNSHGEIKGIKFTVKDDQGKSTTNIKGKEDDPIDPIYIQR